VSLFAGEKAKAVAVKEFTKFAIGFVVSALFGALVAIVFPETALKLFAEVGEAIKEKVGEAEGFKAFIGIYTNNLTVATSAYALGIFFGVVPWIIILVNGFIVGLVLTVVISSGALDPITAILAVLPHGIVEIPALLTAATAGVMIYKGLLKKGGTELTYTSLKLYALSAVLLLVAAFIEAFITPIVAGL